MDDALERFVRNHRQAFDQEQPSDKVWNNVKRQLPHERVGKWEPYWKVAAVLLLISTVYLATERYLKSPVEEDPSLHLTEFAEVEQYYTSLISQKRAEIRQFDKRTINRELLMELDRMDRMYDELKQTYTHQNSNELVLDALISNLQLRIDLLNRQLSLLKKLNNTEYGERHTVL